MPEPYASEFAEVLEAELELIRSRRREVLRQELARGGRPLAVEDVADPPPGPTAGDADSRLTRARLRALDEHLAGISFSGGGIRSGTFAVGLLQGLSALGLLRRFDYLSTVSGGGYAGGWLASWLKRDGDVANVERQLAPDRVRQGQAFRAPLNPTAGGEYPTDQPFGRGPVVDEEPEPVRHLRSYSSYMAPRLGLLKADTWTIIMIWHRNVSVNLMMFLPLSMVLVFSARVLIALHGSMTSKAIARSVPLRWLALAPLAVGLVALAWAFTYNSRALRQFRREDEGRRLADEGSAIYSRMVYPTLVAALALALSIRPVLWWIGDRVQGWAAAALASRTARAAAGLAGVRDRVLDQFGGDLGLLGVPNVVGHALAIGGVLLVGAFFLNLRKGALGDRDRRRRLGKFCYCAGIAGAVGGALLTVAEQVLASLADSGRPELAAMLGTPALLLVLGAALIPEASLLGRAITEAEREWWSRFGALLLIGGLLWTLTFAAIIYAPALLLGVGLPLRLLIASGWAGTTLAGVIAGRNARPEPSGGVGGGVLATVAAVAPPVFLVGFLGGVALLAAGLVDRPSVVFPAAGHEAEAIARYFHGLRAAPLPGLGLWLGLSGLMTLVGSLLIDVNLFSLHAMYANRLIRCYLGASRGKKRWADRWGGPRDPRVPSGAPAATTDPPRDENPVTGFDPMDDLDLVDLRIGATGRGRPYWGPHLLLNTALNLVGGDELAWRDRKGESFTLTPLYCGSKGTGYARAGDATRDNLTLGRAMAISGAAVDPNMRFYQSTALTAFLTLLNARLGYWMENPSGRPRDPGAGEWSAGSPKYADLLLTEFLGRTDGKGGFVHLSDGGHFENLGVYELIRRRCRYIVACDAGEDTAPSDENLATLIRLARIDFGVRIDLDTAPFRMQGADNLNAAHVVVGRVHYEDVDGGQMPGILVYVRISMTGDESSDVQQYARGAPDFPHQATDFRQSFTEDQFESYRALGDHIARAVFRDAATRTPLWADPDPRREFVRGNRRLFSSLQGRWAVAPTGREGRAAEAVRAWVAFGHDLRDDPRLDDLAGDVFPELRPIGGPAPGGDAPRAEVQAVGQALLLMEDAWSELGLAGRSDLPANRGWMNGFRRWAGTDAFRRSWPVFRPALNPDFARFLENELHVAPGRPTARRLADIEPTGLAAEGFAALAAEFDREWPRGDWKGRTLAEVRAEADAFAFEGRPAAWLLFQSPSGREVFDPVPGPGVELPPGSFVAGVAMLAEEAPGVLEVVAYVRRPHRASGFGNGVIGPLIQRARDRIKKDLAEAGGGTATLRAYYPRSGREGDDDGERERWLNFFALYDFRPQSPRAPGDRPYSVASLVIEVPGRESAPRPLAAQ